MSQSYYYIISGLPNLNPEDREAFYTPQTFREDIRDLLHPIDQQWLDYLYLDIDNHNLLALLGNRPDDWHEGGIYLREELEISLKAPENLPPYMSEFLETHRSNAEKHSERETEYELLNAYVNWQRALPQSFLKHWFRFEADLKNLLAGLNSRKHGYEIQEQIIGDHDEAEQIRESREKDFRLSRELSFADELISLFDGPNFLVREVDLAKLRWQQMEELSLNHDFEIDAILAYALKLGMIHRNALIDDEKGNARLRESLDLIHQAFTLPDPSALS